MTNLGSGTGGGAGDASGGAVSTGVSSADGAGVDADGTDIGNLNDENWKLIACIVEVICNCNDHPDETVQIQVLGVLLTAVATTTCEVHERSLLKVVRACY